MHLSTEKGMHGKVVKCAGIAKLFMVDEYIGDRTAGEVQSR